MGFEKGREVFRSGDHQNIQSARPVQQRHADLCQLEHRFIATEEQGKCERDFLASKKRTGFSIAARGLTTVTSSLNLFSEPISSGSSKLIIVNFKHFTSPPVLPSRTFFSS